MIMIRPREKMPNNIVTFKVDPRMTDWDIKNYLEKIYKIQIGAINSKIYGGPLKRVVGGLAKDPDFKIAHVALPVGQTFEWPTLFPDDKLKEEISDYQKAIKEIGKNRSKDRNIQDVPSWFV